MPFVMILVIAAMDLATNDASAAGQVFLCYPILYAASQLRAPAAAVATGLAIAADAVVVLSLKPFASAVTDLAYVSAVLIAMTALLVRAGERNEALVAELRQQAAVDSLTGLVTRRVLDDALHRALTAREPGHGTALVMLDVDRFKAVNDAHGHPVGDAALVHIASVLAAHTRSDTVICRIGGDEIAFLMPGCSLSTALRRAEELVHRVRENPLPLTEGHILALSVSAGVAHAPEDATTITELYAKADAALYNAKNAGRDRVGVPGPITGRRPAA
jgi:diguanylate cyclase (GGDEF)-like protein